MKSNQYCRFNRKFFSLTILLAALSIFSASVHPVKGQTSVPQTFYMLTYDNQTRAWNVWEENITNGINRLLFTLPWIGTETPNQIFPLEERLALQKAINTGGFLVSNGDTSGIVQGIESVDLLDESHLLVQISKEVCDRIKGVCYGFDEFFQLNIHNLQLMSLFKVSYDSSDFSTIPGCSSDARVSMGYILIHPTQKKFSFVLRPENNCLRNQEISEAVIVDYSTLPVVTQKIPMVSGISWSPDGNHLAYYTRESCSGRDCTTSIQVRDANLSSPSVVLYREVLYPDAQIFLAWLDNRTLIYQSLSGSETPTMASWYDIIDQSHGDFQLDLEFAPGGVYRLEHNGLVTMFGWKLDDHPLVGFPAQKNIIVNKSFAPPNIFSVNNKFNQYEFSNLNATSVEIIDSNLQRSILDLTSIVAAMPNQSIIGLTPGKLETSEATNIPPSPTPLH